VQTAITSQSAYDDPYRILLSPTRILSYP
jgi:hypothetical protein